MTSVSRVCEPETPTLEKHAAGGVTGTTLLTLVQSTLGATTMALHEIAPGLYWDQWLFLALPVAPEACGMGRSHVNA